MAQVKSISGACVVLTLADASTGVVPLTALHDTFVPNALKGLAAGDYVRAAVTAGARDSKNRLPLSLQQRDGAIHPGAATPVLSLFCPSTGCSVSSAGQHVAAVSLMHL